MQISSAELTEESEENIAEYARKAVFDYVLFQRDKLFH